MIVYPAIDLIGGAVVRLHKGDFNRLTTYGDDPVQGIVEGNEFTHPVLMFYFKAPSGFYLVNGTRAVAITGQSGKGQLTGGPYNGDMDAYIKAAFAGFDTTLASTKTKHRPLWPMQLVARSAVQL